MKPLIGVLVISSLCLGCQHNQVNKVEDKKSDSDSIDCIVHTTNSEKFCSLDSAMGKSESEKKKDFGLPPAIIFSIITFDFKNSLTINEYLESINRPLPREYKHNESVFVLEKISLVGNTLYLKIRSQDADVNRIHDEFTSELTKLVLLDYLKTGCEKHSEFKDAITYLWKNEINICLFVKGDSDSENISLKNDLLEEIIRR